MSAGAYARKAAAFRPTPLWVTAGLRFGLDDTPAVDGDLIAAWANTVADDDIVYVLGGLGHPDYLDGLPGRVHLLAGPGDPMSVWDLVPDLTHRKQPQGALDATETERARLVADWTARGGLAYVWTGYGPRYDTHKSMLRPGVADHLIVRGRKLAPTGYVDGVPVLIDPADPKLHRLEDA